MSCATVKATMKPAVEAAVDRHLGRAILWSKGINKVESRGNQINLPNLTLKAVSLEEGGCELSKQKNDESNKKLDNRLDDELDDEPDDKPDEKLDNKLNDKLNIRLNNRINKLNVAILCLFHVGRALCFGPPPHHLKPF